MEGGRCCVVVLLGRDVGASTVLTLDSNTIVGGPDSGRWSPSVRLAAGAAVAAAGPLCVGGAAKEELVVVRVVATPLVAVENTLRTVVTPGRPAVGGVGGAMVDDVVTVTDADGVALQRPAATFAAVSSS